MSIDELAKLISENQRHKMYPAILRASFAGFQDVVELGSGLGQNLKLLDQIPSRLGIEVHQSYVDRAIESCQGRVTFIVADARHWLAAQSSRSVDGILCADVVEHFDPIDGADLLKQAQRVVRKRLLVWAPVGHHPQDYDEYNLGADQWQTHRWTMYPNDLVALGFKTIEWKNYHQPVNTRGQARDRGAMWAIWEPAMIVTK